MLFIKILLFLNIIVLNFAFWKQFNGHLDKYTDYNGRIIFTYTITHGRFDTTNLMCWSCDIKLVYTIVSWGDIRLIRTKKSYIYYFREFAMWAIEIFRDPNDELNGSTTYIHQEKRYYSNKSDHIYDERFITKHPYYLKLIDLCIKANVWNYRVGSLTYYVHDCQRLSFSVKNVPNKAVYKELHSDIFASMSFVCMKARYRSSCWYKCETVANKYTCSDVGQVCTNGWYPLLVTYYFEYPEKKFTRWRNGTELVEECLLYDVCSGLYPPTCPTDFPHCFPYSNGTYTCLRVDFFYFLSSYEILYPGYNYSHDSLMDTEYLRLNVTIAGKYYLEYENRSFCYWEINRTFNDPGITLDVSTHRHILSTRRSVQYGTYDVTAACEICESKVMKYPRKITIFNAPTTLYLYNISLGDDLSLYVGQIVVCRSDGKPANLSDHNFVLMTKNFVPPENRPNYRLYIPLTAKLGVCTLNCNFSFLFPKRNRTVIRAHSWTLNIKTFVMFQWHRRFKDAYNITEFAGCLRLAYFESKMDVTILSGHSSMDTFPGHNFSTNANVGGHYSFMCSVRLTQSPISYYKNHDFYLFHLPTYICLLLNYPTRGSFLHCGSNAYPDDQVRYDIRLVNGDTENMTSRRSYIQIPYGTAETSFKYKCSLSMFIDRHSKTMELETIITIRKASKLRVPYKKNDFKCSKIMKRSIENAVYISDLELDLYAVIYTLSDGATAFAEACFCIFPVILILSMVLILGMRHDARMPNKKNSMEFIQRRMINDQLIELTRLAHSEQMLKASVFLNMMTWIRWDNTPRLKTWNTL